MARVMDDLVHEIDNLDVSEEKRIIILSRALEQLLEYAYYQEDKRRGNIYRGDLQRSHCIPNVNILDGNESYATQNTRPLAHTSNTDENSSG